MQGVYLLTPLWGPDLAFSLALINSSVTVRPLARPYLSICGVEHFQCVQAVLERICTTFLSIWTQRDTSSLRFSLTLQLSPRFKELSVVWNCTLFCFFYSAWYDNSCFLFIPMELPQEKSQKAKDLIVFWSRPKMAEVLTPFCASFFSFGGRIPAYNQRQLVDAIFAGICVLYLRGRSSSQPTQG